MLKHGYHIDLTAMSFVNTTTSQFYVSAFRWWYLEKMERKWSLCRSYRLHQGVHEWCLNFRAGVVCLFGLDATRARHGGAASSVQPLLPMPHATAPGPPHCAG